MSTKLSSRLPKPEMNGLNRLARALARHPDRYRVLIAVVDCGSVSIDHTTAIDSLVATARIVAAEPVTERDQIDAVLDVLAESHHERLINEELDDRGAFQQMAAEIRKAALAELVADEGEL